MVNSNHFEIWQLEHEAQMQEACRHREKVDLIRQATANPAPARARVGAWLIKSGDSLQLVGQRLVRAATPPGTPAPTHRMA
jgi:hypothetical protein